MDMQPVVLYIVILGVCLVIGIVVSFEYIRRSRSNAVEAAKDRLMHPDENTIMYLQQVYGLSQDQCDTLFIALEIKKLVAPKDIYNIASRESEDGNQLMSQSDYLQIYNENLEKSKEKWEQISQGGVSDKILEDDTYVLIYMITNVHRVLFVDRLNEVPAYTEAFRNKYSEIDQFYKTVPEYDLNVVDFTVSCLLYYATVKPNKEYIE